MKQVCTVVNKQKSEGSFEAKQVIYYTLVTVNNMDHLSAVQYYVAVNFGS